MRNEIRLRHRARHSPVVQPGLVCLPVSRKIAGTSSAWRSGCAIAPGRPTAAFDTRVVAVCSRSGGRSPDDVRLVRVQTPVGYVRSARAAQLRRVGVPVRLRHWPKADAPQVSACRFTRQVRGRNGSQGWRCSGAVAPVVRFLSNTVRRRAAVQRSGCGSTCRVRATEARRHSWPTIRTWICRFCIRRGDPSGTFEAEQKRLKSRIQAGRGSLGTLCPPVARRGLAPDGSRASGPKWTGGVWRVCKCDCRCLLYHHVGSFAPWNVSRVDGVGRTVRAARQLAGATGLRWHSSRRLACLEPQERDRFPGDLCC